MLDQRRKIQWPRLGGSLLTIAFLMFMYASAALPDQSDLAQKLVGKWEGVALSGGNEQRTLVIESVDRDGEQWIAHGRYGQGEKGSKVEIEVTQSGSDVALKFRTAGVNNAPVELKLTADKELTGTTQVARRHRLMDVPLKLTKVEP
jgi:hypothetical protein